MSSLKKERNSSVDIIRGVAMILVVLGHTISGSSVNYEKSFIFEIIWSLQMPLFMLISGYVMRYSRHANSFKELLLTILRKATAYLLPWCVWTVLVRGIIFGQHHFLNIKNLLFNMDTGYWFLFSLFTISFIFVISDFLSSKIARQREDIRYLFSNAVFYVIGMGVLALIGILVGMNFLCIKLTVYYAPFFFAGFIYGKLQEKILSLKWSPLMVDCIGLIALASWLAILNSMDFYFLPETIFGITVRAIGSLVGCVAICSFIVKLSSDKLKLIGYIGKQSLGIYLVHYLLLIPLKSNTVLEFYAISGAALVCTNFLITLTISILFVWIINKNSCARCALLGKRNI